MNLNSGLFLTAIISLLVNCGTEITTKPATKNPAFAATGSANGIVGTWKLIMETFDDNFNEKLDDEERKMGMKNSTEATRNYKMQFNANGTCKTEGKYNGIYNIKEEGGKKILFVQLDAAEGAEKDPRGDGSRKYYIKSMTGTELLLMPEVSGITAFFWLFKKV
jgi:hypothetical protein